MGDGIVQDGDRKPGGALTGCQGGADGGRRNADLDIVDAIEQDAGRRLVEVPRTADDEEANALGHVVFGLSQAPVDTTIVGGRVLMEHRRLKLDLDEARVNARARELAKALWQRL